MIEDSILPKSTIAHESVIINEEELKNTKEYKLKDNKIIGFCEGIEALKQAIYLILNTERYEYLIYPWNYGVQLKSLIGGDRKITESELKRRIKEALMQDDRIKEVDNFIFDYGKDGLFIEFTIFSIYGDFKMEKVVM